VIVLKIVAKPLPTQTWLPSSAYMNLSSPYPKVPSPAPYDVQFSDNTCVTDDRDSFLLLQLANIKYRTELN